MPSRPPREVLAARPAGRRDPPDEVAPAGTAPAVHRHPHARTRPPRRCWSGRAGRRCGAARARPRARGTAPRARRPWRRPRPGRRRGRPGRPAALSAARRGVEQPVGVVDQHGQVGHRPSQRDQLARLGGVVAPEDPRVLAQRAPRGPSRVATTQSAPALGQEPRRDRSRGRCETPDPLPPSDDPPPAVAIWADSPRGAARRHRGPGGPGRRGPSCCGSECGVDPRGQRVDPPGRCARGRPHPSVGLPESSGLRGSRRQRDLDLGAVQQQTPRPGGWSAGHGVAGARPGAGRSGRPAAAGPGGSAAAPRDRRRRARSPASAAVSPSPGPFAQHAQQPVDQRRRGGRRSAGRARPSRRRAAAVPAGAASGSGAPPVGHRGVPGARQRAARRSASSPTTGSPAARAAAGRRTRRALRSAAASASAASEPPLTAYRWRSSGPSAPSWPSLRP